jgi:hypothetical protein
MIRSRKLSVDRLSLLAAVLLVVLPATASGQSDQVGQWGPLLDWGIQGKHTAVLPTGDVLVWSTGDNARIWDPSVSQAQRVDDSPIGSGSAFDLVARFAGRDVPLRYTIVEYLPPRQVVLEAQRPGFVSRDTITVEPAGAGSVVHYDATLAFSGVGRLFDPVMQLVFNRVGARAATGMRTALNS